ncbi:hypothetical protein ACSLVK_13415 [Photorhabdus tasmaniensis]|uniref:hypothetical protein n=1 Tax=Photorhabdus tasmaniensis TaxID=1004159 RepID=UPI0040428577
MSEKKGFIARLFGQQKNSACCAMHIEKVTDQTKNISAVKDSDCCEKNTKDVEEENKATKRI